MFEIQILKARGERYRIILVNTQTEREALCFGTFGHKFVAIKIAKAIYKECLEDDEAVYLLQPRKAMGRFWKIQKGEGWETSAVQELSG
jgi:hypothetical protein